MHQLIVKLTDGWENYAKEAGPVQIVRIIVVHIAETAGVSAAENDHFPFEHFQKMARFVVLRDPHLNGTTVQFFIQFHRLKSRGSFLVLRAARSLLKNII